MAVPQLKLRMKRSDILELYHVLSKLAGSQNLPPGVCYAMGRSRRFLRDEAESIEGALKQTMEIAGKRENQLHQEFAEKDANGHPVVKNGRYVCGDETGLTAAMVNLRAELDADGLDRKNKAFLAESLEVTLCRIPLAADQTTWAPIIVEVLCEMLEEPTGLPPAAGTSTTVVVPVPVPAAAPAPAPIPFPPPAAPAQG